ncbi:MAG: YihA family ribosome biogenesis GTP-binding protein [Desulfobacteraceae bacterium]|nr:MAG: YihA family ribosome biogenesis GTP-binding protein [Desulfobacteraceae bacterium]
MIIKSAEFVTSAVKKNHYPPAEHPEIAFAGRSNVGKSSLINTLLNRKHLVKTSSTPGRTQLINFFMINASLMFVDLPGFGYARVPQKIQKEWGPMIETYLLNRETLRGVVLIMDIRRNPGQYEFDLINWLSHHGIPCLPVMTKADKLKKNQQTLQHKQAAETLGMDPKDLLLFSAKTRQGKEMIWTEITRLVQPEIQPQTLQEDHE